MKKPPSHSIEYQQFNFRLTVKEPTTLADYKGSSFRGSVRYTVNRVVWAIRDK